MNKLLKYFKNVAIETSKLSTCASIKVGAILVKDKRIIAIGYNGVTSGSKHCDEIFDKNNFDREKHHEWSHNNEIHAEQNLIAFCAKYNICTNKSILFITTSPCIHCAKVLVAAGISKVYYVDKYDKDVLGIDFLLKNGVAVEHFLQDE